MKGGEREKGKRRKWRIKNLTFSEKWYAVMRRDGWADGLLWLLVYH